MSNAPVGMTRTLLATCLVALGLPCFGLAQEESPTPVSPAPESARHVRISFLPPPIEGTISLGIHDSSGKLVRVLHRESDNDDFTIGTDALVTEWDGKNDAGMDLPAGKYHARGYMVGGVSIEGVADFFNDWVTEENSPHFKHINGLNLTEAGLHLEVELASGQRATMIYNPADGSLIRSENATVPAPVMSPANQMPPAVIDPVGSAPGKDSTVWVIDHLEKGSSELEIKQLSATGELLRRLAYDRNDPQPKAIAASLQEDRIFVLEENQDLQRVRGLTLIATTTGNDGQQATSDWKVDFEKKIVTHKDFGIADGKPVLNTPSAQRTEKIIQKLQPNPLKRDRADKIELSVGFDSDGSYLKTSDGLPLKTISDTPNLVAAPLVSGNGNVIDVFQDDGAVVEQFRISNANQIMSFDCGDLELK